jgi:hypothetical protein
VRNYGRSSRHGKKPKRTARQRQPPSSPLHRGEKRYSLTVLSCCVCKRSFVLLLCLSRAHAVYSFPSISNVAKQDETVLKRDGLIAAIGDKIARSDACKARVCEKLRQSLRVSGERKKEKKRKRGREEQKLGSEIRRAGAQAAQRQKEKQNTDKRAQKTSFHSKPPSNLSLSLISFSLISLISLISFSLSLSLYLSPSLSPYLSRHVCLPTEQS